MTDCDCSCTALLLDVLACGLQVQLSPPAMATALSKASANGSLARKKASKKAPRAMMHTMQASQRPKISIWTSKLVFMFSTWLTSALILPISALSPRTAYTAWPAYQQLVYV